MRNVEAERRDGVRALTGKLTATTTTGGAVVVEVEDKEGHGTLLTARGNVFSKEMKIIRGLRVFP